jgi:hypothetical protein
VIPPPLTYLRPSNALCGRGDQRDAGFLDGSDSAHHAQLIPIVPTLDDLSIDKSNDVYSGDADALATRWDTKVTALVGHGFRPSQFEGC